MPLGCRRQLSDVNKIYKSMANNKYIADEHNNNRKLRVDIEINNNNNKK